MLSLTQERVQQMCATFALEQRDDDDADDVDDDDDDDYAAYDGVILCS